jgi:Tfp pilus assembly protein PilF
MKFLLFFSFIMIISSISFAESKRYHADLAKQSILNKSNTTKFNHAVQLLDGYRGDTSSLEEARTELENILKDYPKYPPAYREMGRYYIMNGHISSRRFHPGSLEDAEKSINKAIEINPNYPEAYVLLGHLYR